MIVSAAEEAPAALVFPAWVFPIISAAVFAVLGLVMWSYRDVANRHAKSADHTAASGHTTDH